MLSGQSAVLTSDSGASSLEDGGKTLTRISHF